MILTAEIAEHAENIFFICELCVLRGKDPVKNPGGEGGS